MMPLHERPFVKVFSADGYDFGSPIAQLVKVAHGGLRGNDLREFIKRAGHQFADDFARIERKPGDVPVHLIALGATEDYGPNRNGDGFKRAASRKYHDTFVKYARWYRNHENKDPRNSYGYVKMSSFAERMKRIELLVMLNGTKEAADRNGGHRAEEELEALSAGKDIPVSMACKVPYDVCSSCGNKARSRDEYCRGLDEGGHCKAGGLRNRIGVVTGDDDEPILHADNLDPLFFDISKVPRGADRIAATLGLMKAAGGVLLGGAALAEEWGVTAPPGLESTGDAAEMIKLAYRLASLEDEFEKSPADRLRLAFVDQPEVSWSDHGGRLGEVMQSLARVKVALPLGGFLEMIDKDPVRVARAVEQAGPWLPGVYNRLIKSGQLAGRVENNPFLPSTNLAPLAVRRWAEKKAVDYTLERQQVDRRILRAAIHHQSSLPPVIDRGGMKTAGAASEIAAHYAMYKLALAHALHREDRDLDLTLKLCIVQNYV